MVHSSRTGVISSHLPVSSNIKGGDSPTKLSLYFVQTVPCLGKESKFPLYNYANLYNILAKPKLLIEKI
jgi:hypothetical protein